MNKCHHPDFNIQVEKKGIFTYHFKSMPRYEHELIDEDTQHLEDDVYIHCHVCGDDWIWIPCSEAREIEGGVFKDAIDKLFGQWQEE